MLGGKVKTGWDCRTGRATGSTCTRSLPALGGSFPRCLTSSRFVDNLNVRSNAAAGVCIGVLRRSVPLSCLGRGCEASASPLMAVSVNVMLNNFLTLTAALAGEGLHEGSRMAVSSTSEA